MEVGVLLGTDYLCTPAPVLANGLLGKVGLLNLAHSPTKE